MGTGWLPTTSKIAGKGFSALPERVLKDERWRFSHVPDLASTKFVPWPSERITHPYGSSISEGLSIDLFDQLILDEPHALTCLPNYWGQI